MGITDVDKGCKDKAAALRAFAERRGLALSEICFMGDDVNDLGAMELAGLAAAPANAPRRRLARSRRSSPTTPAGNGAVRELVDAILARTGAEAGQPELMKLSDYVMQFVADQGVKHVFLVPGGGAMHLNDSLGACTEIESVCNLHEQASAIAAEAYAKATNDLGVAHGHDRPRRHQRGHRAWPAPGSIRRRACSSPARSSAPTACSTPTARRSACGSSACRRSTSSRSSSRSPSTR